MSKTNAGFDLWNCRYEHPDPEFIKLKGEMLVEKKNKNKTETSNGLDILFQILKAKDRSDSKGRHYILFSNEETIFVGFRSHGYHVICSH